jgi:CFEM-containing surface protein
MKKVQQDATSPHKLDNEYIKGQAIQFRLPHSHPIITNNRTIMKSVAVFALALAAVANAQSAPACATTCVAQTPTSCSESDISCLCHDQNFITQATQCILVNCKGSDLTAAEQFAQQLCETVGVTLTSTPPLPTSTGAVNATGSASGSYTTTPVNGSPSGSSSGSASSYVFYNL